MCDFEPDDEPFSDDSFQDEGFGDAQADDPLSLDWEDWMITGPMSEDISEEKRKQKRIRRKLYGDV